MNGMLRKIRGLLKYAVCLILSLAILSAVLPVNILFDKNAYAENDGQIGLAVDPVASPDSFASVLYDNTNGLPTSEANAVAMTEEGFIWIGSYSGLIRYDGNTFERMDSTGGITSVVSLYADSKNRLWVGTNDGGVAVIDNGETRMFNKEDGLRSLSVRAITEDGNGLIYVGTTRGVAVVDTELNMSFVDDLNINDEFIRSLKVTSDNTVYGITLNGCVFTMADGKLTSLHAIEKYGIEDARSILPDNNKPGYIYIGTSEDRLYYGSISSGFECFDTSLYCINELREAGGEVWICADDGVGVLKNGTVKNVYGVPMNNSVEDMMVDYQGNMWFVSSQQGVMKIVPDRFQNLFKKCNLEEEVVYSTCLYDGLLFVGTKNNGLRIIKDEQVIDEYPITEAVFASGENDPSTDLLEKLGTAKIRSIIKDSKNNLWISTFGDTGLVRLNKGKLLSFTEEDGLPSSRVRMVAECSDGKIIVACTGGVAVIENDKITKVYREAEGLYNTEILNVTEGFNGEILAATDGGGIYVIKNGRAAGYGTDKGLTSDVVMKIKRDDERGIYWLVASNAILYMDKDLTIHPVTNFPYSNNFDLYESDDAEMWILSSNGIYVVPTDELLANEEMAPVFYGFDDGLPCINTSNSYSELTEDGELYIAGTTGVSMVNIDTPPEAAIDVKILVPYLEVDGKKIYPDEDGEFTISSDAKRVTIYPYILNYSLMNPDITYHLEGFEESSTTLKRSELTPVDYTNLKGGKYRFVLELKDSQGNTGQSFSVEMYKKKALTETLWFKLLVIALALLIIFVLVGLFVRRRIARYRKKAAEDKELVREMVEAFARVIDMKDKYTRGHSSRVAAYTAMLAREMGCDEETVDKYYNIALLHDIGKVGVPADVLNKPGKLTDEEFAIIKSHSAQGYNVLKDISIMPELAIGAGSHHERPDGKGYPEGLKGDEIPEVARIIAVADTFDAMYSDRPYRKRMNFDKAVSIIKEVGGTQLAQDAVDAFLRLVEKGKFRAPNDKGGGSTEDIDNIRKKAAAEEAAEQKSEKPEKTEKSEKST